MERDRAANEERQRKKSLATLNAGEKPFIALGKSGKEYVYFVTSSRSLECLTAREHTGLPLLQLAPKEYWDGIDARSGIKGTDCFQHCLDAHAGAAFDIHRVRGEGMWNEGGHVLYNAGASCYAVEKDRIVPVSSVRPGGRVYTSRVTMPEPGAGVEGGFMSDEAGRAFVALCHTYPWREERGGDLFAGLMVQALLCGFLPLRVHGWITAPAGSGKSTLLDRIDRLTGGFMCCMKGSSEAGVRQRIAGAALPVMYDEAETDPGEKSGGDNMKKLLEMSRAATDTGELWQGGQGGKPVLYLIHSAFVFFSVNSALNKAANESRFMHLHLMPSPDKGPMDEAFRAAMEAVKPGALLARLMVLAPVILQNIEVLREELGQGRREYLFAVVLACRHALTSREPMAREQLEEAAVLVKASAVAKVETDDSARCMDAIMQYRPQGGNFDLQGLLNTDRAGGAGRESAAGEYGVKIVGRNGGEGVFIHYGHTIIRKALAGTEWDAGCRDALLNLQGAELCKQKIRTGHNPVWGIWLPAFHVFDVADKDRG